MESSTDYEENCWLTDAAEYLEVVGIGRYNSLQKAYDAITGDSGTIKVIASTTVEAVLPGSPAGKNIIFDLNGQQLTYAQPLINNSSMTIIDSSTEKTGQLNNFTASTSAIINKGSLIIESGHLRGGYITIQNNGGSLSVVGGTIEGAYAPIHLYADSSTSADTSVNISGGTIIGSTYGIYASTSNTSKRKSIRITGGSIKVTGSEVYGIKVDNATPVTIDVENSTAPVIEVTGTSTTTGLSIESSSLTINNGQILVNGYYAYGIRGDYANVTFNNGTLTAQGINATGVHLSGAAGSNVFTMNGGSLIVNSTSTSTTCNSNTGHRVVTGVYAYRTVIKASIHVTGSSLTACDDAYGLQLSSYVGYDNHKIMEGADIVASGAGGVNTGIIAGTSKLVISGGKIYGGTYGVQAGQNNNTTVHTVTIGSNDGNVSTSSPEIIGGSFGLTTNSYGGYFNYYDGILRGGVKAYKDSIVIDIAETRTIHLEDQIIDGVNYDTRWLIEEQDVAQIIGGSRYKNLASAITDAQEGATIELLADNYVFSALSIPSDKKITIATNGFDIILGNPITNNGKITIMNESTDDSAINYYGPNYAITNSAAAELNINGLVFACYNGIKNEGTASILKTTINANNVGIHNTGNMTAANTISIKGNSNPIYVDGGTIRISDATILGNSPYINSGEAIITNSNMSKTGDGVTEYITNKGSLSLNSTSVALSSTKRPSSCSSSIFARAIYNTGALAITNNSSVSHFTTDLDSYVCYKSSTIYNAGGSAIITDSTIQLDTTNMKSNTSYDAYAVYSPTGNFTIESGAITTRAIGPSYGIYNESGNIIIGVAEPTTSPNYGRDTADVKQDNPDIEAISTTANSSYKRGIGVKNASGGRIEFYDGKVAGNTAAFSETLTGTEYLYEPCTELDTTVTPNLYTSHLFWMRDGQSSCGN